MKVRPLALETPDRFGESRQQACHFASPAARQKCEKGCAGWNAMTHPEVLPVAFLRALLDHGVTDERRRQTFLLEIGWLERQQRHDVVEKPGGFLGLPRPPRPHHRRHIADERHAGPAALQSLLDPAAKAARVDRDDRRRTKCFDPCGRLSDSPQYARRPGQHLRKSHDGQFFQWEIARKPLGRHSLAADPGKAHPAIRLALERRHEPRPDRIAGRLPGHEENERAHRRHQATGVGSHSAVPMPMTNRPAASAFATIASRSITSAPPASIAMPLRPAAFAFATVRAPMAGKSTRVSWPGFFILTRTPPRPLRFSSPARLIIASVPSTASRAKTTPCCTTTPCPTSVLPSALATS